MMMDRDRITRTGVRAPGVRQIYCLHSGACPLNANPDSVQDEMVINLDGTKGKDKLGVN